jgi:hypothetical protein
MTCRINEFALQLAPWDADFHRIHATIRVVPEPSTLML